MNFSDWNGLEGRAQLTTVRVSGIDLTPGDRVRLWPRGRADIMDLALEGKTATIASIEEDYENQVHLAVVIDDDPGRDLGLEKQVGHRFFFSPSEVEPLPANGPEGGKP